MQKDSRMNLVMIPTSGWDIECAYELYKYAKGLLVRIWRTSPKYSSMKTLPKGHLMVTPVMMTIDRSDTADFLAYDSASDSMIYFWEYGCEDNTL